MSHASGVQVLGGILEKLASFILKDSLRRERGEEDGSDDSMAYVENGVVKSKRTVWRLSIISDFFWAIVSFIGVFFMTMFSMEKSNTYKKGSGSRKKWDGGPGGGPGGGSGRGPYGGGPRGPRTLSDLRQNDHSALPACGSCCGG